MGAFSESVVFAMNCSAYRINAQTPKPSRSSLKPRSTIAAVRVGHTLHNNDTPRFPVLSRILYLLGTDDTIDIDEGRGLRRIDVVCLLSCSWSGMGVRVFEFVIEGGGA